MRSIKLGVLNGFAEEMLSGQRTIKAYGREEVVTRRFQERNKEAVDAYYAADYYGAIIGPGVNFINNLSIAIIIIFGGIFFMFSQSGAVGEGSVFFYSEVLRHLYIFHKLPDPNEFAILSDLQSALPPPSGFQDYRREDRGEVTPGSRATELRAIPSGVKDTSDLKM